jgi:hypothetical protein
MSNGVLPSVYIYRAGKDGLKRRHQFHILADLTPLAATEKSNLSFKQNTNRVNVFNRARSGSGRAVPQLRQPISHPILDPTEPSRESTHTHVTMPPERYRQACPCTVASPCPCTLHAGARWFAFIGGMWRSVRRDGRLRVEFSLLYFLHSFIDVLKEILASNTILFLYGCWLRLVALLWHACLCTVLELADITGASKTKILDTFFMFLKKKDVFFILPENPNT